MLVQPCDCRLMVYDSLDVAQRIWIKGHDFSLEKLIGPAFDRTWVGCSAVLSRLAPSDHHRFYVPCRCTVHSKQLLPGYRYSVKPVCDLVL